MACQIIYAPRTIEDAKDYSELLGTETVKGKSVSRNRGKGGGGSVSTSDQSRALMLPQEMFELDKSLEIIKFQAFKPILCKKIVFHEEPIFQNRLSPERDAAGRQKGLPVATKCIPPKLDVQHMLEVMRGTKFEQIKTAAELKEKLTGKELIENHSDYIQKISDVLGFDADFLNLETEKLNF